MLDKIALDQVRMIASLARDIADSRDAMLRPVREGDLAVATPGKGEHDPAAAYGLGQFPFDHPKIAVLRGAIAGLPSEARQELLALMRMGHGDYGPGQFAEAVADAGTVPDDIIADNLMDEANLHDYLMKALFELKLG